MIEYKPLQLKQVTMKLEYADGKVLTYILGDPENPGRIRFNVDKTNDYEDIDSFTFFSERLYKGEHSTYHFFLRTS